jgi:hypothetical protein
MKSSTRPQQGRIEHQDPRARRRPRQPAARERTAALEAYADEAVRQALVNGGAGRSADRCARAGFPRAMLRKAVGQLLEGDFSRLSPFPE